MKTTLTCLIAAAALSVGSAEAATPSAANLKLPGFTYVKTVADISEYTLDANGLTVLVMPEHSAPVVTFMVTYRVGSRNEVTGTTGATHILEHMMFKGSANYSDEKGNSVKLFIETVGGNLNANTYLDRTCYFAELGREHLEQYIAIEADRMRNLLLRDADRKLEMTVVRNEFEMGENDPGQALDKEIWAAAFAGHPYHHPVIGWRSDIENVPIEKLRGFYDTFYWPNNATVSIIGDVDPATALALVDKYYGKIPRSPAAIPDVYTVEPQQTGPRRVTVRRAGELGVVGISFKSPEARSADYPALDVLSLILSSGKTSRFYRGLTDKSLTTSVSTNAGFFHDPSLFDVTASLAPGVPHEKVEKALLDEIEKLKKDGVTPEEMSSALGKYAASTAYGRDGSFAIASILTEAIAAGDWTLYFTVPEAVKKVTADDVKRVANTYLDVNKSTTGWFIPVTGEAP